MSVSPFRHLMANVLWSDNGWTEVDPLQPGKSQFGWTRDHPNDHADAKLFNWDELQEWEAYVPINRNPRFYTKDHNGSGLLFIASRNPRNGAYYIVGFFSECDLNPENWGWFSSDIDASARLAVPIRLEVERHCPQLLDGRTRSKTFGQNNFNYIRDEWAKTILEDALAVQPPEDQPCPGCTLTGESPRKIIRQVLQSYFGVVCS